MNTVLVILLPTLITLTYADSCKFCPNGTRVSNGKTGESNGCGTAAIAKFASDQVTQGMVACCHGHDICYTDCSKTKDECDDEFDKCISQNVRQDKSASIWQLLAETLLAQLVRTEIGCKAYTDSQQEYCNCSVA